MEPTSTKAQGHIFILLETRSRNLTPWITFLLYFVMFITYTLVASPQFWYYQIFQFFGCYFDSRVCINKTDKKIEHGDCIRLRFAAVLSYTEYININAILVLKCVLSQSLLLVSTSISVYNHISTRHKKHKLYMHYCNIISRFPVLSALSINTAIYYDNVLAHDVIGPCLSLFTLV